MSHAESTPSPPEAPKLGGSRSATEPRPPESRLVLVFTLFFASGVAGLVYQVVWSRLLTLVIGVSIFAVTAVICTYMAGLALGSYFIGRHGDRWGEPLRVYGVIEGAIGIYAALTPWIFDAIEPIYIWGFQSFEGASLNTFRIAVSALVLLLPTALMGGTLPLLSRVVTTHQEGAARSVGRLYAINTFGAVVGCVLPASSCCPKWEFADHSLLPPL
jgi:spermidine synthase